MTPPHSAAFDHTITHRRAPARWRHGFPLGNGELGAMFWGDGNPLAFTLDKADLWDLRRNADFMEHPDYNYAGLKRLVAEGRFAEVDEIFEKRERRDNLVGPTKISLGRAELQLGEATEYECRLELGAATVAGVLRTEAGEYSLQCFVHRERNILCLRVTDCPTDSLLTFTPLADRNESLAALAHPRPTRRDEGGLQVVTQAIPAGVCYAVAWNQRGPDFFFVVESADSEDEATAKARTTWAEAAAAGIEALHLQHLEAWRAFWAGSAVYLPEQRMEFLWYFGLYLLASAARRGSIPPGLQGLWSMDGIRPPWRGDYHADMNVQETFWPACASGHLDLLDCWCDSMRASLEPARAFTRRFFGSEGTFWPCCTLPHFTLTNCWHTVQFAWSHSGWLAWLVWLRWRHSMDLEWLAETGYPVVAEVFRFYRANLQAEADGRLHVPLSSSPEYRENKPEAWCKDPNIDLALIRRCCDWVVEMEQALGAAELTEAAREVRAKLVPSHLTANRELCLWAGKPLDESHRHPSHLMAIHPAMELTIEGGEEANALIEASLQQYFALGQYLWAGHTYAQLASLAAVVGRGEFAYDCLLHFAEYWLGPNGLHFNRDIRNTGTTAYRGQDLQFTMEANCGISAGLSDMLVQGWGDTVRVFPAVPDHWREVAFRALLTEGAFRVSAVRCNGRTVWVEVAAGVDRELRLRDPFPGQPVQVSGGELRREGRDWVGELKEGQTVALSLDGLPKSLEQAVARVRDSNPSRLGLR